VTRSDNGPEFVAKAVQEWIAVAGAKTAYIERGSQRVWKYFRMSVWDDFIRRLEQDLAECRSDVELLESGRVRHRERRDGGAWVDTNQRELGWHKKTIGMYEGLVRKLRAVHGGGDL
jgi:hypothetical protein